MTPLPRSFNPQDVVAEAVEVAAAVRAVEATAAAIAKVVIDKTSIIKERRLFSLSGKAGALNSSSQSGGEDIISSL